MDLLGHKLLFKRFAALDLLERLDQGVVLHDGLDRNGVGGRRGYVEQSKKGRVVKHNLQVLVRHHDPLAMQLMMVSSLFSVLKSRRFWTVSLITFRLSLSFVFPERSMLRSNCGMSGLGVKS
jgi:hypothetical protein